jgi:hypothetical protein
MRLSDIMSQMGLAGYAEVGLLLFLAIFTTVTARVFLTRKSEHHYAALIPLENDTPAPTYSVPKR